MAPPPNPPRDPDSGPTVGPWQEAVRPRRRTFPGPRGARATLRVAMDRAAFAELTAHAKDSLDAEVCGVLAGQVCEDDEGPWLHVEAAVRGHTATSGKTHVTFTQETWNQIHTQLEQQHPKLRMVGWYHTHPGFGVEFSEMDLFIQRNFFPAPSQIAYLTDPLGGAIAIGTTTPNGVDYLERFWVDGREQPCQAPRKSPAAPASTPGTAPSADDTVALRITQLTQAIDDLRASYHRFLLFCSLTVGVAVVLVIAWTLWRGLVARTRPPEVLQYLPIPIRVGDKAVMLGVGVVRWEVPPELDPLLENAELRKRIAELEKPTAPARATNAAATSNAPPASRPPPATPAPGSPAPAGPVTPAAPAPPVPGPPSTAPKP